jgi:hypothetical protein
MTDTATASDPFAEWCVVELMGRVRLAGRVTEQRIAGGTFLRLDIHGETGPAVMTQFLPPPPGGPIYRLTVVSEETARLVSQGSSPEPVAQWELSSMLRDAPGRAGLPAGGFGYEHGEANPGGDDEDPF